LIELRICKLGNSALMTLTAEMRAPLAAAGLVMDETWNLLKALASEARAV